MKISENTAISMPARNLISIIGAVVVGVWFAFGVIERLNSIETKAANEFIAGVPKGEMVSPQIQELYLLTEFLAGDVEKLKEQVEGEIPNIKKNDMTIQFHEDRLIKLEGRKNGTN